MEWKTGTERKQKNQKRKAMRMVCMLAACVLLGYSVYGAEAGQEKIPVQAVEESEPSVAGGEDDPAQTADTEMKAAADTEEIAEQTKGFYPLEGGILYYKIYNETHLANPTADAWERILEEGEISIEQLLAGEVITLPQPETPEGFAFLGWAAHFSGDRIPIRSGVCLRNALPQRMRLGSNRMRKATAVWIFTRFGALRILLPGR